MSGVDARRHSGSVTLLRIRPTAVLVASVGLSGILAGLALANFIGDSRPDPAAAPGWVAPAPPAGRLPTTAAASKRPAVGESTAPQHRGAAPAATSPAAAGAPPALPAADRDATGTAPPSPPGPLATTTPPALALDAVEGESCTAEGDTGLSDDNTELTCVNVDGRLHWLSPTSLHSVPPG